jgi:hypothetical protein
MPTTSTQQEILQLQKRLAQLQDQAEDELRQRLKEARAVVTDLEMQLSEITGRPSATMIQASDRKRWPAITDEQTIEAKDGAQHAGATEKPNLWTKDCLCLDGFGKKTRRNLPQLMDGKPNGKFRSRAKSLYATTEKRWPNLSRQAKLGRFPEQCAK